MYKQLCLKIYNHTVHGTDSKLVDNNENNFPVGYYTNYSPKQKLRQKGLCGLAKVTQ